MDGRQEARQRLLVPGPTPVPEDVRAALAQPMIAHRSEAFRALYRTVQAGLAEAFGVDGPVCVFPGAGTGGFEAAIVNLFSPGDRVLVGVMGDFGDRFAKAATILGLEVDRLEVPWGETVPADAISARLAEDAGRPATQRYRGVFVTHNETSTGAAIDLEAVGAAVAGHGALVVVDSVSGAAGMPVRMRDWGLDAVLSASQKAFMVPPGLAMLALGPRAREAAAAARLPRFYWDVRPILADDGKGVTPYTPAVSLWFALDTALKRMQAEGWENVFARHRRMRDGFRAGSRVLGLEPLAADAVASPTVTALQVPSGLDGNALRADLAGHENIAVADGQGPMKGKLWRISHMGAVTEVDLTACLAALARVLKRAGQECDGERAVAAARAAWHA